MFLHSWRKMRWGRSYARRENTIKEQLSFREKVVNYLYTIYE
jgi:hypothetical protein